MKLTKNKVLVLALALSLLAIASMGTLAWFTDFDSVNNNFYIANSEEDPDKIFSVDVWEDATADDSNEEDKIQTGIDFNDILPGDNRYKEVNIENTGYYAQYVRATVTVTGAAVWQDVFDEVYVPLEKIATDLNGDFKTDRIVYDADKDTLTYVLYTDTVLDSGKIFTLFTNVHIPEALDRFQAGKLSGEFAISVVADAVQTENVGDNAIAAFTTVGMYKEAGKFTVMATETGLNAVLASGLVDTVALNDAYAGKVTTISADVADVTIDANGVAVGLKFTGVADDVTVINVNDNADASYYSLDLSAAKEGSKVNLQDCVFISTNGTAGAAFKPGKNCEVVADHCSFVGTEGKQYGIWGTASGGMTFTNCSFNDFVKSWAILVNGTVFGDITFDGCTFTNCQEGIFKGSVAGGGNNGLLNGDFTFTNNKLFNCNGHNKREVEMFTAKVTGTITVNGNTRDDADWVPGAANGIVQQ